MKTKALRSPIIWFGGKGIITRWIMEALCEYPHKIYVEPFGGGASVLIAKEPSSVEVYNDLNAGLVNFFHVLSDTKMFGKFMRIVSALPVSRRQYYNFRNDLRYEKNPVVRAAKWFVVARQSFAGKFGAAWGYAVTHSTRGMAVCSARWLSSRRAADLIFSVFSSRYISVVEACE